MGLGKSYILKGTGNKSIELMSVMDEDILIVNDGEDSQQCNIDYDAEMLYNSIKETNNDVYDIDFCNSYEDYSKGYIKRSKNEITVDIETNDDKIDFKMILED